MMLLRVPRTEPSTILVPKRLINYEAFVTFMTVFYYCSFLLYHVFGFVIPLDTASKMIKDYVENTRAFLIRNIYSPLLILMSDT